MEKKKMPIVENGHFVVIPVGVQGGIYENALHLTNLINKWCEDNPTKKIVGKPTFYFTPSSGGRSVSVDSIFITWESIK